MRHIAAIVGGAVLAACSTSNMNSWIGATDTRLVSQWGAPDMETTTGGGVRVLTYQGRNGYGQIICRRNFTVDADYRVVAVSHNCPF